MNYVDLVRHVNENFPEHKKNLYFNMAEIARIFGRDRGCFRAFLTANAVPGYRIGKQVMYALPEVLEAVNATRCR